MIFRKFTRIDTGKVNTLNSKPPSKRDISQTVQLFDDFNINRRIPVFKTKEELFQWRDRVIRGCMIDE